MEESFGEMSKRCGSHIMIDTKNGHRCICDRIKGDRNNTCNTYNCPKRRWK